MSNQHDPYVYPATNILINKFDIKDASKLQEVEGLVFALQSLTQLPEGNLDSEHIKAIHYHFFNEIYAWAGDERTINIAKKNSYFAHHLYISKELQKLCSKLQKEAYLQGMDKKLFCERISFYFNELNAIHPFREGNGRTQRAFCGLIAERAGFNLDWTLISLEKYLHASIVGFSEGNYGAMECIFNTIIC